MENFGLCACGCDKLVRLIDPYGRHHKFAQGHSNRGDGNPQWNGGKPFVNVHGYVEIRDGQRRRGKVIRSLEHRVVMEKHLGRKLQLGETVHHINHNKTDNRIENLRLFSTNGSHISYEKSEKKILENLTYLNPEFD